MLGENDLQMMINGLQAEWQKDRSNEMMTLGALIEELKNWSPDIVVRFDFTTDDNKKQYPESLDSYRGYYCDLSVDYGDTPITVGKFLEMLKDAMGEVFTGYKGGDFMMGKTTPIWVSRYGWAEEIKFDNFHFDDETANLVITTSKE